MVVYTLNPIYHILILLQNLRSKKLTSISNAKNKPYKGYIYYSLKCCYDYVIDCWFSCSVDFQDANSFYWRRNYRRRTYILNNQVQYPDYWIFKLSASLLPQLLDLALPH